MKESKVEHKAFTIEDVPAIGLTGRQVTLGIFALSVLKDKCDDISNLTDFLCDMGNNIIMAEYIDKDTRNDFFNKVDELVNNTSDILVFIDKITEDIENINMVADELFGVSEKDKLGFAIEMEKNSKKKFE